MNPNSEMRYTKKPVTIEAFQITEELAIANLIDNLPLPFGITLSGSYRRDDRTVSYAYTCIETPEGKMKAKIGDWIIKGVKGELYPCKPDVFEASYDSADLVPSPAPVTAEEAEAALKWLENVEILNQEITIQKFGDIYPEKTRAINTVRRALSHFAKPVKEGV
jgi:hypothetical protein